MVALTLDESGNPETADGRIAIAEKNLQGSGKVRDWKKDILIDALCMTISSDRLGALTTLETVKRVRQEMGGRVHTCSVSNISFGLPVRENINANFFTLALYNGLNAAIINPGSEAMMCSYHSFRALAALDENCGSYIEAYKNAAASSAAGSGSPAGSPAPGTSGNRMGSDTAGRKAEAAPGSETAGGTIRHGTGGGTPCPQCGEGTQGAGGTVGKTASRRKEPLDVINTCMIPALDHVGKGFEAGTVFLPQLLMSAEAAKAAFDVIKEKMAESGQAREKKEKSSWRLLKAIFMILEKNIVRVLLENYSYDVLDLGKDVAPEQIVRKRSNSMYRWSD